MENRGSSTVREPREMVHECEACEAERTLWELLAIPSVRERGGENGSLRMRLG